MTARHARRPRRAVRAAQAVLVVTLAGVFGSGGAPAQADAPIVQGWWTTANQNDALPVTPPGLPVSVPPDVPADGLLVQGGAAADSPTAYAALVYDLDAGSAAQRLVLNVAPTSATTPQAGLKLCALKDSSFSPEQGGPIAKAPAYDCAKSATAQPSADGTSYTFDAGKVADGTTLAVAILPTTATDRVVLSKPDSTSLATTAAAGGSSAPPAFSGPAPAAGTGGGSGTAGTGTAGTPQLQSGGTLDAPPAAAPVDVPGPAVASAVAQPAQSAAAIAPVALAGSRSESHSGRTALIVLAALAVAAVLWSAAGASATSGVADIATEH
jgi:hypothetical protein